MTDRGGPSLEERSRRLEKLFDLTPRQATVAVLLTDSGWSTDEAIESAVRVVRSERARVS